MPYKSPDPNDIKRRLLLMKERTLYYHSTEDQKICDETIELIDNMIYVNAGLAEDVKRYFSESLKHKTFLSHDEKVQSLGVK